MSVEAKKLIDLTRLSRFKELMDQSVDGKLSRLKLDLVQVVSGLPDISVAEEGVLYLVPTETDGEYDLYAKETVGGVDQLVKNSSLSISGDLDGFLTKADAEEKYISTATSEDGTITLSRPDGSTVVITVNNVGHAAKADRDGNGAVIADTYATKTELASKANTSDLSTVATSGSYNDLLDKPTSFDVDLSNYYTKPEVDDLLSNIGSGTEGGDDAQNVFESWPDGAEAHNAMWGGRDITAAFYDGSFSESVAGGSFYDIFPGDYIRKKVTIRGTAYNVKWVVADCDYWINKGDGNGMTAHHVAIVPQQPIFNYSMNDRLTTEGGYAGSRMYKEIIPACATGIVSAFGSDHILTFRDNISNNVDTSHISSGIPQLTGTPGWGGDGGDGGEWVSVQCNLMSEKMVYGAPICSAGAMDNIMATRQMSAFRLSEKLINYDRQRWWLRDVVSSKAFAIVGEYGGAYAYYASWVFGVRPFFLLA